MHIMKSNENPYLRTQIAIVKTLLSGSKKTQKQIADETNYEKSTISHALDDLEKKNIIIRESTKKESGNRNKGKYKNNLCWLTYEINNGYEILQFFKDVLNLRTLKQQEAKDIIETLQKNNKFLDILLYKHPILCHSIFSISEVVASFNESGANINAEEEIQSEKEDFKNKLKSSPTFFKICFLNDSEYIINIFTQMYWFLMTEYVFDTTDIKDGCNIKEIRDGHKYAPPFRLRNIGYKVCVFMDVLNGSPELSTV